MNQSFIVHWLQFFFLLLLLSFRFDALFGAYTFCQRNVIWINLRASYASNWFLNPSSWTNRHCVRYLHSFSSYRISLSATRGHISLTLSHISRSLASHLRKTESFSFGIFFCRSFAPFQLTLIPLQTMRRERERNPKQFASNRFQFSKSVTCIGWCRCRLPSCDLGCTNRRTRLWQ